MDYSFSEIYLFRLHKMEPEDHVVAKWKLSFPGSKTGPVKFTQFFFTDLSDYVMLTTRLPALSLARGKFCHGSVYWSWIAQRLEHQYIKLESQVQAPVQDRMFPLSIL